MLREFTVKADYCDNYTELLDTMLSTIPSDRTYCRSVLGQVISPDGISKPTVYCYCYDSNIANIHELKSCVSSADFAENLCLCT
jgi:hypothetical protein